MDFLLVIALALVALWTGRIARSKGRSPWLWSGASFFLGIAPFAVHLLAVVPLVILLFIKNPVPTRQMDEYATCPRCETPSTRKTRYCINCGWEMARLYNQDAPQDATGVKEQPETASAKQESNPTEPEAETNSPPEVAPTLASTATPTDTPTRQAPTSPVNESSGEPVTQPTTSPPQEPPSGQAPEEKSEDPPAHAPLYRTPVPVDAPTASAMTERGVQLFNQGRTQESIDQFTKAIALDPNYTEAWAKRAEAYALLGRGEQAAEDQRRLDALNAGSSGV